jgi:hypothetical protein
MSVSSIELILIYIKDLPLKEALVYLVSRGIIDFSKTGYQKIKKIIRDKQNEGKYAFVPNPDEAISLQKSSKNPRYKEISLLVPKYKHLGLIMTGFLLLKYNNKIINNIDSVKNNSRVAEIKRQILSRPGGGSLLKIAKFPSTEFFSVVLAYLHKLKINGYPEEHLEEEFNDLVNSWQTSSKYVKNEETKEIIISFCKDKIKKDYNRFFLLGMYEKPIETIEEALKELNKEIEDNKYEVIMSKRDGSLPIIEVFIFKKLFNS